MKRVFLLTAALPMLLLAGCHKQKVNPDMPSVVWESNSGFATRELTSELDAKVTVKAPEKFEELSLVLGLGDYNILANQYIKIGNNKGTSSSNPVLDLVSDDYSVDFLKTLGVTAGPALMDKEQLQLDLKAILEAIIKGQVVENNTSFSIEIRVKDQQDNSVSRTASFHFTAAPTISWSKNSGFADVDLDAEQIDCKVEVWAPGKIDQLTVTLGDSADQYLKNYVQNRTTDAKLVIDLVNDSKVVDSFKGYFPAGTAVTGKDQAILDFGFMYNMKYDLSASTNIFTVTAVDANGKETVKQVRFVKK